MTRPNTKKVSIPIIIICALLMASFIAVQIVVFDLYEFPNDDSELIDNTWIFADIEAAKSMYSTLHGEYSPVNFIDESVKPRTLENFYELRAYSGAPPVIPHSIVKDKSLTGDSCLGCHEFGGYAPRFAAYTPVVPHPEKKNCRQCHNPINEDTLFKSTEWVKHSGQRGHAKLPGSPLIVPHRLQMRENCLSCHSGPAAVAEIRTSHPERLNCLQCHVVQNEREEWVRK
ncbi:MAG: hypothetical protein AB8G05_16530 [Oligoflexales bacterium]